MKRALIALTGLTLAALTVSAPAALAQDPTTGGVTQAEADAACTAVATETVPTAEEIAAFRAAYNTVDNGDDGPASAGLSPAWQRLIYLQELHIDYLGLDGLDDSASFTCGTDAAVFAELSVAEDVASAICADANLTVDDISDAALRARVVAALTVLDVEFADARADCPPLVTDEPAPPVVDEDETPADEDADDTADADDDLPSLPNAAPRPVIVDADLPVTG